VSARASALALSDLPQLFERSARQGAQRVLRHDPEASTAAQSLRSSDRRSMSPRRVPSGATRRTPDSAAFRIQPIGVEPGFPNPTWAQRLTS
jgi:hypothetical protein